MAAGYYMLQVQSSKQSVQYRGQVRSSSVDFMSVGAARLRVSVKEWGTALPPFYKREKGRRVTITLRVPKTFTI